MINAATHISTKKGAAAIATRPMLSPVAMGISLRENQDVASLDERSRRFAGSEF